MNRTTFRLLMLLAIMVASSLVAFSQGITTTSLSGAVLDPTGSVIQGAEIIVKDETTGAEFRAVTAGNGTFAITGITPGDYSLFAWEAMEPNSYRDPDVLRPYESKGRSMRIAEASNQTIEVRVIPAQLEAR